MEKESIEIKIVPPKKFNLDIKELIRYKGLLRSYIWRDINVKYKQTVLGLVWVILQPLIMMLIFVVFFSKFLNIPTDNVPAPIFYYSGLIIWTLFSSGLSNASNSMLSNSEVIKKVYFPRLIIPISSIFVALFDYVISISIFAALIIYYSLTLSGFEFSIVQLLYCMPAAVFITCVTSFGAGSWIAALSIKFRDFRFVLPFLLQFLLFVTPVIYPVSVLNDYPWLKYVFAINPMFSALNLSRLPFMDVPLDAYMLLISTASMCFLFVIGVYTFKKTERYFADIA